MRFYTKQHQYYCGIDLHARKMRSTRDLMRRRNHLMRKRAELLVHIQNTNSQYNLPEFQKKIAYKTNRYGVAEQFDDPSVRSMKKAVFVFCPSLEPGTNWEM